MVFKIFRAQLGVFCSQNRSDVIYCPLEHLSDITSIFSSIFEEKILSVGVEMPPPNALKRKILLKNKRLKPDVEKTELELYLKGEFQVYTLYIVQKHVHRTLFKWSNKKHYVELLIFILSREKLSIFIQ